MRACHEETLRHGGFVSVCEQGRLSIVVAIVEVKKEMPDV
jgi:hypothetical protein